MIATIGELLTFVVIIVVLWRYAVPPLRKNMRAQQDLVRRQLEESKAASERLRAAELKYQEALAEARTEAAKIRDTARADAQRIAEEMREFAQREVERIRQRGQDDLESTRLGMIRELRTRIGELTVSMASELVTDHLSDQVATVDRLLDELEAMAAPQPTAASGKGDT